MPNAAEIRDFLFSVAPQELKMDFDNVGLLVGSPEREIKSVLFALDITTWVIAEAERIGADLIVSHHPIIWEPMKALTGEDVQSKKVMTLIEKGICAVCMHTNMDIAAGGVNDLLMEALGGRVTGILEPTGENVGCGRVGELSEHWLFSDFLAECKKALNAPGLRYYAARRPVYRLAVMGGSGGSCIELAASLGCDTYVTSDVKYDGFLLARELGINLIDAGHFCTENLAVPELRRLVDEKFPTLKTAVSADHEPTAKFF